MRKYRIIPKNIKFVSIVSEAANNLECFKLSKQKMLQIFYGVVARPNYPMLRKDSKGPYQVYFEEQDIKYMFDQFKQINKFDIEHNNKVIPIKILKQFITNDSNSERFNTEPGSWVMAVYISDTKLWNQIKDNILNGFSPEVEAEEVIDDLTIEELINIIQ